MEKEECIKIRTVTLEVLEEEGPMGFQVLFSSVKEKTELELTKGDFSSILDELEENHFIISECQGNKIVWKRGEERLVEEKLEKEE